MPDYRTEGKRQYRQNTHHWLQEKGHRIWNHDHTKLVVAVCDLAGPAFDENVAFWRGHGLDQFVVVDRNPEIVARWGPQYPECRWIEGNLFEVMHRPDFDDVGVFLLDMEYAVGSSSINQRLPLLRARIDKTLDRFTEVAVVLNVSLDAAAGRYGRDEKPSVVLMEATKELAKELSSYRPRRRLDPSLLLPPEKLERVDDPNYIDSDNCLDPYYIYRSSFQRMACLRLLLV